MCEVKHKSVNQSDSTESIDEHIKNVGSLRVTRSASISRRSEVPITKRLTTIEDEKTQTSPHSLINRVSIKNAALESQKVTH